MRKTTHSTPTYGHEHPFSCCFSCFSCCFFFFIGGKFNCSLALSLLPLDQFASAYCCCSSMLLLRLLLFYYFIQTHIHYAYMHKPVYWCASMRAYMIYDVRLSVNVLISKHSLTHAVYMWVTNTTTYICVFVGLFVVLYWCSGAFYGALLLIALRSISPLLSDDCRSGSHT